MNWPSQEKPEQFSKPEEQHKGDSGDLQSCHSHHRYRVQDVGHRWRCGVVSKEGPLVPAGPGCSYVDSLRCDCFGGGAYDNYLGDEGRAPMN